MSNKSASTNSSRATRYEYDFFISHASEDKDSFARPLAEELAKRGLRVWYDEFSLDIGDSLRESIDLGLGASEYGVVILSKAFFGKEWPRKELNGLNAQERDGRKVILPVWHGVSEADVRKFSPMLADRVAAVSGLGVERVASDLERISRRPSPQERGKTTVSSPVRKVGAGEEKHAREPLELVKLVQVVTDEVTVPRFDGTRGSALYRVPIQLSVRPNARWAQLFVEAWNHPPSFTTMHRPGIASVVADRIVLDGTTLDEVKKYHRDTVVLAVDVANRQIAAEYEAERLAADRLAELRRQHEEEVRRTAEDIKFD